ncbi:hypothetical protein ACJX0J_007703 [Zea mays]
MLFCNQFNSLCDLFHHYMCIEIENVVNQYKYITQFKATTKTSCQIILYHMFTILSTHISNRKRKRDIQWALPQTHVVHPEQFNHAVEEKIDDFRVALTDV